MAHTRSTYYRCKNCNRLCRLGQSGRMEHLYGVLLCSAKDDKVAEAGEVAEGIMQLRIISENDDTPMALLEETN